MVDLIDIKIIEFIKHCRILEKPSDRYDASNVVGVCILYAFELRCNT